MTRRSTRSALWRAYRREPWWFQTGVAMFAVGLLTQTGLSVYILTTL